MNTKTQGAVSGAIQGGKVGGPLGAVVGGVLGAARAGNAVEPVANKFNLQQPQLQQNDELWAMNGDNLKNLAGTIDNGFGGF